MTSELARLLCCVRGEQWVPSIPDRALPIQYTLKPLHELLDGEKRQALQFAIEAYTAAARQTHTAAQQG